MVCHRPPLMAWDDDEVEIEWPPFMALRGLLRPPSSRTNARRTNPFEPVPGAGFQPRMPEPQPHKCTPGVKPSCQEDRQPCAHTLAANSSGTVGDRQAAPCIDPANHKLEPCRL